ncbi:vWA domain-containing protein [Sphingopyxis indica]|uniref:vWA domain-containing protein n=1 Tax=Sphingopyxis indica TaxID=436663 RepID=UPI000B7897BD|nr:hypothetical protein [Sphingopyxis indica]
MADKTLIFEGKLAHSTGFEPVASAFGQQGNNKEEGKAKSCSAIDVLAPMSSDRGQLRAALQGVRAVDWTPLAAGLDRAEALLTASSTPREQIIYVVSDGEETCGGDPVTSARRIDSGRAPSMPQDGWRSAQTRSYTRQFAKARAGQP